MTDALYAKVDEPTEVRRELLQSSKEILDVLKAAEEYKMIKADKKKLEAELKDRTVELTRIINKLRLKLPKTGMKPKPRKEPKQVKKAAPSKKPKLAQLEQELAKIETKLGTLE